MLNTKEDKAAQAREMLADLYRLVEALEGETAID